MSWCQDQLFGLSYAAMSDIPFREEEKQKLGVITSLLERKITNGTAAKKLGLSVRQIQRLKIAFKKQGYLALVHKLKGRASNHKLSSDLKGKALFLVKEKYSDFHPTLASEKLEEYHNIQIKPETLRVWMIKEGVIISPFTSSNGIPSNLQLPNNLNVN